MIELKCKMCGANLQKKEKSNYAVCEYCGSKVILQNTDDEKIKKILINARRAVEEKNWSSVDKHYDLLQEELPEDIIVEAKLFRAIARIMCTNSVDIFQKRIELCDTFDMIENYYNKIEDKEETLKIINDLLFKLAFPKGKITCSRLYSTSNDPLFYGLLVVFNNKLEQLSKTYRETYIRSLISKNKQIIMIVNNEERKALKPIAVVAFFSFLIIAIFATISYLDISSFSSVNAGSFFSLIVIPWSGVIITRIIWKKMR